MVTKPAGRRAGGRGEGQQPTRSPSKTQHAFCSCRHPEPQPGWSREVGSQGTMALSPTGGWGAPHPHASLRDPSPAGAPKPFCASGLPGPPQPRGVPVLPSRCQHRRDPPGDPSPREGAPCLSRAPTRREGSAGPRRSGRSSLSLTRAPISPPPPPPLQPGRAGRAWAMGRRRRQLIRGGAVGSEPPRRGGDTARKLWWWHLTGKTEPVRFLRTVDMHIAPQGHLR